ncbi:MAG: biopolymer transporter ExbD [Saprospiraceae bacterium]
MLNKKKARKSDPVNAGSMADIAFLLLIFFLVTTTILEDQGIYVKLPPWEDVIDIEHFPDKNVLTVLVNAEDQLLVEGELMPVERLRETTKEFISNPQGLPTKPKSPKNAVVSIMNDRSTSYEAYLSVYNEIKGAYNELWEAAAQKSYSKSFNELPVAHQKSIRAEIPLVISEAEPTDHAPEQN